ncbi:T9SS type A sorting domain-containing protein [bacterium]|nr:T9SS type A sorting domain-containing protein [bacterium]
MLRTIFELIILLWVLVSAAHAQSDYTWQRITSRAPFLERDGAGMVAFNSRLWLLGGWNPFEFKPNGVTNEIWSSADGFNWIFEGYAPWSARHLQGKVVFENKIWIIGGDYNDGSYKNDVWNSSDGVSWNKVLDNAPWGGRVSAYISIFNNKIWLMGGEEAQTLGDSVYNDIWNTDDGINWQRVVAEAPWAPRSMVLGSAVLNNKIWIYGGGKYNDPKEYYHDVWSSSDGIVWDSVNVSPPWQQRVFVNIVSFDDKLWVLDGYNNGDLSDVWYSSDGTSWTQLPDTPWPARHAASVAVFDSSLWITAGRLWNDVWRLKKNTLVITSPPGGSIKADTVISITWKTLLGNTVSVDYSTDSGATWNTAASGIPASQENYSWRRSLSDPSHIKLRIRSDYDLSQFDIINLDLENIDLQQGISAFYPLNSDVLDMGGDGLNGTGQNVFPSADRFGNEFGALSFNGSNSLAALPAQSYTPFTNDFTISFWERADNTLESVPLSIGNNFLNNFDILFNSGGIGLWPLWNGGGENGIRSLTYPGQYTNQQWHHIAITKRGYRVLLFVDGRYKFQTVYANSIAESNDLILGQSSGATAKWNGSLDELRIYNRSLNDQEISTIYNFVNHPPLLSSLPDTFLTVNAPFSYSIEVMDPDTLVFGDKTSVKYVRGPSWLDYDSLTNTIFGSPGIKNSGDTSITFHLQDLYGSDYLKTISLNISYPNTAPYFLDQPDSVAYEDALYNWLILAGDSEAVSYGDHVRYTLLSGPNWITLDTIDGILAGTPTALDVGDTIVAVRIYDWMFSNVDKVFPVTVKHTNHSPVIQTELLSASYEDRLYSTSLYATDQDSSLFGDVLVYRLLTSPVWLSIDSVSGVLSGIPKATDVGDTIVTVWINDGKGGDAVKTYLLQVNHTNHAPFWVSEPDSLAKEDEAYHSRIYAQDQDSLLFGDYLRYRISYGPHWLMLDSISGVLSGTPPNNTEGDTAAVVKAADQWGFTIQKECKIRILNTNYPPSPVSAVFPSYQDTLTLFQIPIQRTFRWTVSIDPDIKDTVRYTFRLKGNAIDTTISGIPDTSIVLPENLLLEQEHYTWRVFASDGEFDISRSDSFSFQTTKKVANSTYTESPTFFGHFQNYPNPFNPNTKIRFQVPERSKVKIEVYNILGQLVQVIFNGKMDAQYYEMDWRPLSVASGIYFVRVSAEGLASRKKFLSVRKMTYLK